MKDKIFNALKQDYSHLGLGEAILMGLAESLAGTGLVTDENIVGIVAGQKAHLEALQKSNDKRVNDALAKAKKDAEAQAKEQAEKLAKAAAEIEALKAKQDKQDQPPAPKDERPEWFKKYQSERDANDATLRDELNALKEAKLANENTIKKMKEEKAAEDAKRASDERDRIIRTKATEKGIPEWLINHGFADVPEDMSNLDAYLDKVASEIQTQFLPNKQQGVPAVGNLTQADIDNIVKQKFGGK